MLFSQEKESRFAAQGFSMMIACDHFTMDGGGDTSVLAKSRKGMKKEGTVKRETEFFMRKIGMSETHSDV